MFHSFSCGNASRMDIISFPQPEERMMIMGGGNPCIKHSSNEHPVDSSHMLSMKGEKQTKPRCSFASSHPALLLHSLPIASLCEMHRNIVAVELGVQTWDAT
jgi:hypothetical protein